MDTLAEVSDWHLQCLWPRFENSNQKSRYILRANAFLDLIWERSNDLSPGIPMPPQLEVDDAENTTISYRGSSADAVQLRFKLPEGHKRDDILFYDAVQFFCTRVFDLKANLEIEACIMLLSRRSLLGIAPLSSWFRFCWTQSFLDTFVHKQVPVLNDVSVADFSSPWYILPDATSVHDGYGANWEPRLRGAAFLITASDRTGGEAVKAIKAAILGNMVPEIRRPDRMLEHANEEICRTFVLKVSDLLDILNRTGQTALKLHSLGKNEIPALQEVALFNQAHGVFGSAFDLLTMNKEVLDVWQEIVASAAEKVSAAAGVAGFSFAFFCSEALKAWRTVGWQASSTNLVTTSGSASPAATGGAALLSTMSSTAVLGTLGLSVASTGLFLIHFHYHNKALSEAERLRSRHNAVQGIFETSSLLAQWMLLCSNYSQTGNGEERPDLQTWLGNHKLVPSSTLLDYQENLQKVENVIRQQLEEMQKTPRLRGLFRVF